MGSSSISASSSCRSFVDRSEAVEFLVGVVALAIIELGVQVLHEGDFDAAEVAVLGRVGGVVPDEVIVRDGVLGLDNVVVEVVVIEEGVAARIASQCIKVCPATL
jgi:hypothetical protein